MRNKRHEAYQVTPSSVPSPCISICQIDPATGNCLGCYRTREEIALWPRLDDTGRYDLLETLKDRRAEKTGRPKRRSRRQNRGRIPA